MPNAVAALLTLCAAITAVACSGSSDSGGDVAYSDFYRQLEPQMQALERDLAALTNSAQALQGEPLSANLLVYGDTLRATATSISELDVPPDARDPATALVVATRDLADVSEREADLARGVPGSFTAADVATQGLARAGEWYNACHKLQDIALARKINTDLRCVTTLGGGG